MLLQNKLQEHKINNSLLCYYYFNVSISRNVLTTQCLSLIYNLLHQHDNNNSCKGTNIYARYLMPKFTFLTPSQSRYSSEPSWPVELFFHSMTSIAAVKVERFPAVASVADSSLNHTFDEK